MISLMIVYTIFVSYKKISLERTIYYTIGGIAWAE